MGYTLIDGTKTAKRDLVAWVMGDCSDDVNTLLHMVNKINEGYDMVIGSRYIDGGSGKELGLFKTLMSSGYTFTSRILFGIPIHDSTNAFRMFRKSVFDSVVNEGLHGDFGISPQFAIKAHKKGYKLGEVPTVYSERKAGKPKFKMLKMGQRYIGILLKERFA